MLHIAFFSEFKDADYVVFWGDRNDMIQLRDALARFCATKNKHRFPGIESDVILQSSAHSLGMHKAGEQLIWALNATHAAQFRDKVAAIVESDGPCHNYLECDVAGEIAVLVTRDEYPPEMRP
jgi:hypothetical protein